MKLCNGEGQLGKALATELKEWPDDYFIDTTIYHTWNVADKSQLTQDMEVAKLTTFLDTFNKEEKLVFISTMTTKNTPYLRAKLEAEDLVYKLPNSLIIRLPTLVGKGVFNDLRSGKAKPDNGSISFATIEDAVHGILLYCSPGYNGLKEADLSYLTSTCKAKHIKYLMDFARSGYGH
jgi:hypothetical protein